MMTYSIQRWRMAEFDAATGRWADTGHKGLEWADAVGYMLFETRARIMGSDGLVYDVTGKVMPDKAGYG